MSDLQDQFNQTGFGKAIGAFGDYMQGDNSPYAQWQQGNQPFSSGSMADQMGGNDISGGQHEAPDDTGYGANGGMGPDDSSVLSPSVEPNWGLDMNGPTPYDDNGAPQDNSFAAGGAVPSDDDEDDDSRAIPKGAAQDPQTNNIASALQTIDDIMQHGYKINGLGGQSQTTPQDAAPAGGGSFAGGGIMPPGGIPVGGAPPPPNAQPLTGGPSSGIIGGARRVAPFSGRHGVGLRMPSPMPANARPFNRGFADGGPVPDDDDSTQQQPAQDQPDPNQGGFMQQVGQAASSIPSPAAPLEAPVKRILNLIQGGGAMPMPQAQQLEHQSGDPDPNTAKIKTAAQLANTHGPDAAWSYLQNLRKQFDLNKTNAAVKAAQGNIPQSTIAATHALTNVLDGTSTRFVPTKGGIRVTVHKVGPQTAQRFDDGGSVDDNDTTGSTPPASMSDANGNDAEGKSSGSGLLDTIMSVPQYLQFLRGRMGQYDELWNTGIANALKSAMASPAGPTPPQFPASPQKSAAYGEGAEGGAPLGTTRGTEIGSEDEDPQESLHDVPMPQARQAEASGGAAPPPQGGSAPAVQPKGGEEPQRASPFSKDIEQQAWRLYPNLFGDAAKRAEYVRSQGEEETKHANEMEKTNAIWGSKKDIAQTVGQNRITIQELKDRMGDRVQAATTARQIQVTAMKLGGQQNADISRQINAYVASGQTPPPALLEASTRMINEAAQRSEQQHAAPAPIANAGNPNANQPQQAQQRIAYVNNKPYYVDATGKVLGPAQQ